VDRRRFLAQVLAAGSLAALARPLQAADLPLGFMLHAVRTLAVKDLRGTLQAIAALGYTDVELVSFKGYASPAPRDGFGPLAPMQPADIRAAIADAGLSVSSAHFKLEEFDERRIDDRIAWAHGVGLEYMTVADIPPATTLDDWKPHFDTLNRLGERVRRAGLRLGLHTQVDMWRAVGTTAIMDALLQHVSRANCEVQLDLSTTQSMGVDPVPFLQRYPGRVFALHLRDGRHRSNGAATCSRFHSARAIWISGRSCAPLEPRA
jgi:sugar phosphate isomerase/epimerase